MQGGVSALHAYIKWRWWRRSKVRCCGLCNRNVTETCLGSVSVVVATWGVDYPWLWRAVADPAGKLFVYVCILNREKRGKCSPEVILHFQRRCLRNRNSVRQRLFNYSTLSIVRILLFARDGISILLLLVVGLLFAVVRMRTWTCISGPLLCQTVRYELCVRYLCGIDFNSHTICTYTCRIFKLWCWMCSVAREVNARFFFTMRHSIFYHWYCGRFYLQVISYILIQNTNQILFAMINVTN